MQVSAQKKGSVQDCTVAKKKASSQFVHCRELHASVLTWHLHSLWPALSEAYVSSSLVENWGMTIEWQQCNCMFAAAVMWTLACFATMPLPFQTTECMFLLSLGKQGSCNFFKLRSARRHFGHEGMGLNSKGEKQQQREISEAGAVPQLSVSLLFQYKWAIFEARQVWSSCSGEPCY